MRPGKIAVPAGPRQGDVLYFDSQCPVCRTEVKRLQQLAEPSLSFQDINQTNEPGLDKERLFSELHLRRADGSWVTGLDANISAWQHTRLRPLASALSLPLIRNVASLGYRLWLRWYQWQRKKRQ
mgnify:CR=1 FL=1